MINVSDKFKETMKKPVKTITASIALDDGTVITGSDKLIKVTIDSSGHLFGTATSVINVELFGTDYNLIDHTFSVIAKTLVDIENDTWEEANLGLFYVEESTADFEKKTTRIKGYDLMGKLAKTAYNSGTIQFPCTVKELINQLAERFEFTVDTNLDNLPNITYQIPEDLYAKISNCTYRDILGEIAGATATIAVFNGKTLSFRDSKKKPDEDEIWTYDNLKTLKYKPKYGPVNSLVLARMPQEDNIATSDNDSITANGLTEVKLANNEILDDDRRSLIDPIFNSIKGLSYHPFEAETTGLGWHKPGDLVSAQAGGGLMNGITKGYLGQKTTTGKNLFDPNFANAGRLYSATKVSGNTITVTKKGSDSNTIGFYNTSPYGMYRFWSNLLKTNTVTLSFEAKHDSGGPHVLRYGLENAIIQSAQTTSYWKKYTLTIPKKPDNNFVAFIFYSDGYASNTESDGFSLRNIQIEVGDIATEFEPYTGGGYNLFDEFSGLPVKSPNGVTLSNQNGVLKLTGKPTIDWLPILIRNNLSLFDKTAYTVVSYNGASLQLFAQVLAYKKDGSGADTFGGPSGKIFTFTTDSTKYDRYAMKLQLGAKSSYPEPVTIYNNFALFRGAFTESNLPEYSPYNSSLASPRPLKPAPVIERIENKATIVGKNLFRAVQQNPLPEFKSIVEPDGSITFGGKVMFWWGNDLTVSSNVYIPANTQCTLSIEKPLPFHLCLGITGRNGRIIQGEPIIGKGKTSVTFIIPEDVISCWLYLSINNSGWDQNDPILETNIKVQIEYGDIVTPYKPFESVDFNIPVGENIFKLTDTIYDEVNLENGVTKLVKRVGKLELNGNEYFDTLEATNSGQFYTFSSVIDRQIKRGGFAHVVCSHMGIINGIWRALISSKSLVSVKVLENDTQALRFMFSAPDALSLGITNVTTFKNWLKSEKAKGTPVTVYYELKEPQITELGRTNLNQVYVTDTHLELGNGIKEAIKGVAPTATQTDYARAGGITKTIYNTEIKVDKQKQEIESIVSKQTQVDQQITDEFSKITQNIKNVVTTIQTTGGGNLIKNSVGYAKNQDGTLVEWTKHNTGEVKSYTSPESKSYGAISGNAIELRKGASITQRLNVASSGKIPYSLSFKCKKGAIGTATVKLSNTIDSFVITIPENKEIIWQSYDLTNLDPSMNYLDITVSTSNNCEQFLITDLMVNMGDQSIPWVQANGEILNTQVAVNDQGMMVSSSVYSGDYVQITPLGMSGHSNVTGTDEEVFKLNRDVTETSKLSARKEISMEPIKIIPVKDGDMSGWNFVG